MGRGPSQYQRLDSARAVAVALVMAWGVLAVATSSASAGEMVVEPNPDAEAEALAIEAHQILTDHCAEVEGSSTTLAAKSVTQVSEVWARISAKLEDSNKEYLRYWRGVLEQCLNQNDRALTDLKAFVEGRKGEDLWASLVLDADSRIRRLEAEAQRKGPQVDPRKAIGVALGAVLTASAIASGIGSGLKWQQATDHADLLYASKLTGANRETQIFTGNEAARSSQVLGGLAVGCGVGAAVAFVIAATSDAAGGVAVLRPPVVVPTRTGAVAVLEGRW